MHVAANQNGGRRCTFTTEGVAGGTLCFEYCLALQGGSATRWKTATIGAGNLIEVSELTLADRSAKTYTLCL